MTFGRLFFLQKSMPFLLLYGIINFVFMEGDTMGKTNTKKMVQGAMIAAVFGMLSLLNTYTGSMFDIFICYAMVIPLVWYGYTYTIKDNIIVCFVSMIVIIMMGLPFFVISSFSSCLAGLFIGEALKRKAKKEIILFGTLIVTFLNNFLIYEVFAGLLGVNLVGEIQEMYQMLENMLPDIASHLSIDVFLSLIPIILLMTSVMEMYVIIMLCQLVLTRLKVEFPGSFHIASLHLSPKIGLVLVMIYSISYIMMNFAGIQHMYLSYLSMLSLIAFVIEGIAFLSWLLIVKNKASFIALVFIGVFIPVFQIIYVIIGIADIFSDLRGKVLYNMDK